jgi:glycosyltransferase involved in cell wall biosynthesis
MRIALVHYSAPPAIGGVERVLAQQAAILQARGHKVVVVCATKGAKVDGAIMEYAPNFYVKRVRSALAGCEVVAVHNMFTMPFNWEASKTLAELNQEMTYARFFNWVHDVDVSKEDFAALNLNATHVAVSEVRHMEFCERTGIPKNKCHVVPNGVDSAATLGLTPKVAAFAEKHHLLRREIVLFHPTRVLARKNIEMTIEVTAALQKLGVDVAAVVTGAPDPYRPESVEYAQQLRALSQKKKVTDRVLFVGDSFDASEDDVRCLYACADALFFPSKAEGFGLPVLEAALHRLPVFCSDIKAHREVAHGAAEFFKLEEKPAAIAERIQARLSKDKTVQRKREVQRKFDWGRIYEEYLEPLLIGA